MDYTNLYLNLHSQFPDLDIYQNHPLAPYTTLKIGGPADIFIHTKTNNEFISILKHLSSTNFGEDVEHHQNFVDDKYPITILGNGSNVLISDAGIRGIVIKNSSSEIIFLDQNQVKVDSGVQLPQLLQITADHQLSGLEEFAYIPSSLGGAVVCNIHGVNKSNFDQFLNTIDVFDLNSGEVITYAHDQLQWGYDYSSLQGQPQSIVLSATLKLAPGNTLQSKELISQIITKKTQTQSMNSLGSVFKNPPGDVAGRIIDQELGLKGYQLNNVQISPKHANFIVNLGEGTAHDYLTLIKMIQTQAKEKLNLDLETEIKFLGEF